MNLLEKNKILVNGLKIDKEHNIDFLIHILEKMVVGILILSLDNTVLYVNEKYTEITGVSYDQIVMRQLKSVRPGAVLGDVVHSGQQRLNLPRQEGDVKYFVDLAPIRLNGSIIGGITIMKDYQDAKAMSEQLKYFEDKVKEMESLFINKFSAKYTFDDIVAQSNEMENIINLAKRVAKSNGGVILTGNTGTGKELFAQSIHNHSNRKNKPFVPINVASIPVNLIESELFGYTPGAFTGAGKVGKIGLFELANGGTLFLDEIENMGFDLQNKLLRVLQEQEIRRIGGNNYIDIDIRVISATNVNIEDMIKENKFREDLYYRLCVFPIHIPSLENRRDDIRLLADHFLYKYNVKHHTNIAFSKDVYNIFENYDWPGNVRELQNSIEYLAGIDDDKLISAEDLPNKMKKAKVSNDKIVLKDYMNMQERKILIEYLNKYGNSVEHKKAIANMLDISIATLYNKLRHHDLL